MRASRPTVIQILVAEFHIIDLYTVFTIVNEPKYAISDLTLDCHNIQPTDHFKYLGIHFIVGRNLSVDITPVRRKFLLLPTAQLHQVMDLLR